jgi:hypothetical protein
LFEISKEINLSLAVRKPLYAPDGMRDAFHLIRRQSVPDLSHQFF